jgi:hypothetical protein
MICTKEQQSFLYLKGKTNLATYILYEAFTFIFLISEDVFEHNNYYRIALPTWFFHHLKVFKMILINMLS